MGYSGGPRCCPIALPVLALCPRRELGPKIRAPRAPCVVGGAVNRPAQGLSGPHTWGRLLLISPAPLPVLRGGWVCVWPWVRPSPALGQQLRRCPLHVPWAAPSCLGQGQARGPMSAAPGCRKKRGGGSRECWGREPHAAFGRCFVCCVGRKLRTPGGRGRCGPRDVGAPSCPDLPAVSAPASAAAAVPVGAVARPVPDPG